MTEFPGIEDIISACCAPSPLERLHHQHARFRDIIAGYHDNHEAALEYDYTHLDYLSRGLESIFNFPARTVEVYLFKERNYFSIRFILDIYISPYIFPHNTEGLTRLRISGPTIDVGRYGYIEVERSGYQLLESVIRHIKVKAEQDYRAQHDPLHYSVRLQYNAANLIWDSEIYPDLLCVSAASTRTTADYRVIVASNAQAEDQTARVFLSEILAGVRQAVAAPLPPDRSVAIGYNARAEPANMAIGHNNLTFTANKKALAKARQHLLSRLTPEQLEEFKANETVTEVGASGTTYRLTRKRQINIQVLSPNGQVMYDLCAVSSEMNLPLDDQLAAQLLDIRTNEQGFLEVAIKHSN